MSLEPCLSRGLSLALVVALAGCGSPSPPEPDPDSEPAVSQGEGYFKGNLHTHSFWSDGDDYPERIIDWYKTAGYDFVALSEHNVLAEGERFIDVADNGGETLFEAYRERFGDDWVEDEREGASHRVRLKTFEEYRGLFEEPGAFLIIQAEEITDSFESKDIHVNATNLRELVEPQGGTSVSDVMQRNVDAVLAQRERTGQAMFPHINHPNFGWSITIEDLMALEGEKFFEVYNGHPAVHNEGDEERPSTERMWDILLAERIARGDEPMYGIAVDDAHNYHDLDGDHSNPGRGWVMVAAENLDAESIVTAMEAGRFYGSSGVTLERIDADSTGLGLEIRTEPGVTYRTTFIGTRSGYDQTKEAFTDVAQTARYRYSDEIGVVLAEVEGASPRYEFQGDELYVRAKVVSSKPKENPYREGELEAAWVQPQLGPLPSVPGQVEEPAGSQASQR